MGSKASIADFDVHDFRVALKVVSPCQVERRVDVDRPGETAGRGDDGDGGSQTGQVEDEGDRGQNGDEQSCEVHHCDGVSCEQLEDDEMKGHQGERFAQQR